VQRTDGSSVYREMTTTCVRSVNSVTMATTAAAASDALLLSFTATRLQHSVKHSLSARRILLHLISVTDRRTSSGHLYTACGSLNHTAGFHNVTARPTVKSC